MMKKLLYIWIALTTLTTQAQMYNNDILRIEKREQSLTNVPTNNLVGYFEFENNEVKNLVGDKEEFTTTNPLYTNGWVQKCFDATTSDFSATAPNNDFGSFADVSSDKPFSISGYINTTDYGTSPDGDIILGKGKDWNSDNEWFLYQSDGYLGFACLDSGGYFYNIKSIPALNTWVHFVITYDGSGDSDGVQMYFDTVLQDPISRIDSGYNQMVKQPYPFVFGNAQGSNQFKGKTDSICLWDKELNQTEVTAIHQWQQAKYFMVGKREAAAPSNELAAFPTAYGAGAYVTGGRGGQVIHVTTLNWSGPGSLKAALQTTGARTIVFDVSGEIVVTDNYYEHYGNGDFTIAGQTAPEGGITIRTNYFVFSGTNNAIFRYVRFRNSNVISATDTVNFEQCSDLIFDHCTFSHGHDEAVSVTYSIGQSGNATIQNCFLQRSKTGSILGVYTGGADLGDFTFRNNLIADISHRFPNPNGNGRYDIVNNVVYNHKERLVRVTHSPQCNVINNYYKPAAQGLRRSGWFPSPNPMITRLQKAQIQPGDTPLVYTAGNIVTGSRETPQADDKDMWTLFDGTHSSIGPVNGAVPSGYFTGAMFSLVGRPFTIDSANDAYTKVVNEAGANKYLNADGTWGTYQDTNDVAYKASITTDGFVSASPSDFEYPDIDSVPYPVLPNNTRPFGFYGSNPHIPETWFAANVPSGKDHNDTAPSGYTYLEEYLNQVDYDNETLGLMSPMGGSGTESKGGNVEVFMMDGRKIYEGEESGFEPKETGVYIINDGQTGKKKLLKVEK